MANFQRVFGVNDSGDDMSHFYPSTSKDFIPFNIANWRKSWNNRVRVVSLSLPTSMKEWLWGGGGQVE